MKKTLPLTSPQSKTSDPPRTTEDNHPAPSSLVASKASAVRAAESEVTWVAVVSKRNPTKRELDFEAAVYEPQRSSSRPARTTSKATSKEVAFPPPRPKERGHGTRQARGNPAQPKKKRRRGRRGQGPQRQEKREARRNRRESEGARGSTKQMLYCLQKDCCAMKKQVQELSAAVAAVMEALSSVVHVLTHPKSPASTLPAQDDSNVDECVKQIVDPVQHEPQDENLRVWECHHCGKVFKFNKRLLGMRLHWKVCPEIPRNKK